MQACVNRAKASWELLRSDVVSFGSCVDNASVMDCKMADELSGFVAMAINETRLIRGIT